MNLRLHRLLQGLTQLDFGRKIGRSQTHVSLIEGYVLPDNVERTRIAEVLQVDPNAIEYPEKGVDHV